MRKNTDEYYLMHKDIIVGAMEIGMDGAIHNLRRNESAADHFPIGGRMNDMKFHGWWRDRAIPKTRHGAKNALQKLGYASTDNALVDNLALSLSDCYWIQPRGAGLYWKDVNLFANDFVDTFGEITINKDHEVDLRRKTRFDCAASQGELQKKWCIDEEGRRYLVKGNYGDSFQQSLNELFATELHRKQGYLKYTSYYPVRLEIDGGREGLGCLCYNYCNEEAESISAWELLQTVRIKQNESWYYPLKSVCLEMGMSEKTFDDFMDYEILTDYLISNTDRHMNNIAVMRNPDTLELLGFAPIFDSGNSMFYSLSQNELERVHIDEIRTHSFVEKEKRLLRYIKNRSCVDPDRAQLSFDVYRQDVSERHGRIPLLEELYHKKLERLLAFQRGKDIWREYGG